MSDDEIRAIERKIAARVDARPDPAPTTDHEAIERWHEAGRTLLRYADPKTWDSVLTMVEAMAVATLDAQRCGEGKA